MEHTLAAKNASVLGIQTEHQPDAQLVQTFQRFRVAGVLILFQERVIEYPYQLTSLQGDFHFLLDMFAASVHKELQAVVLLLQVRQLEDFRLVIGTVHIVNLKFLEVADHNPAWNLVIRQIPGIAAGLLIRGQHTAVRLLVPFPQINVPAFLLNQDTGGFNIAVNEAGVVQFHRDFKRNGGGTINAKNLR